MVGMKYRKYLYLAVATVLVALSLYVGFKPIGFKSFESGELRTLVITLLSMLLFVSLIIERALDIFLTIFRAEDSEKLNYDIRLLKKKISSVKYTDDEKKNFHHGS